MTRNREKRYEKFVEIEEGFEAYFIAGAVVTILSLLIFGVNQISLETSIGDNIFFFLSGMVFIAGLILIKIYFLSRKVYWKEVK